MTDNEREIRRRVVEEAKTWLGTPYISNGMTKGPRGGTDCAMLLLAIYGDLGLVPKEYDPRPYSPQWHLHKNEEKYLETVLRFAKEVKGPQERKPLAGDVVMFKIGMVSAHAAIITDWPNVIHAVGYSGVVPEDISTNTTGKRALNNVPQRFFSIWG